MFNDFYYTFTAEPEGERILKIGQHLPKLWAIKYRVFFMKHGVYGNKGRVWLTNLTLTGDDDN